MRSRGTRVSIVSVLVVVASLFAIACEKTTHDTIDKWRTTEQGPSKLEAALKDGSLDPDLRAHAAQALVAIEKKDVVKKAVAAMSEKDRADVITKLADRLWEDCRINDELQAPTQRQLFAKDALFDLREFAADPQKDAIDGHLIDWLTGYYEERSKAGEHSGEVILRAIGPKAAPKLLAAAKKILTTKAVPDPKTGGTIIVPLGDKLLIGIAYTGSPEAIGFLLDLAEKTPGPADDDSLPRRSILALYHTYIKLENPDAADSKALKPFVDRFYKLAGSTTLSGEFVNSGRELLVAIGPPDCVKPMEELVKSALKDENRMWASVQGALACGGPDSVVAMAEMLPEKADYDGLTLKNYFVEYVKKMGPTALASARTLLDSKSWVARILGVQILEEMGDKSDAKRVAALAGDKTKLRGWWSKHEEKDRKGKVDPTLGEQAKAAAQELEKK